MNRGCERTRQHDNPAKPDSARRPMRRLASACCSVIVVCTFIVPLAGALLASPASAVGCTTPAKGVWSGVWSSALGSGTDFDGTFYGKLTFKASTTPGDYVVAGSMKIAGSAATTGGPVHGTLACNGTFLLGVIEGTVTVNFSGTMAVSGSVASGTYSLSNGADFGSWNGGLLAVSASPLAGGVGTSVTVSTATGSFVRGENVSVTYATRVAATPSVTLCSGTADVNTGAFSCTGTIPTGSTVGPVGKHTITATGASGLIAKTSYTISAGCVPAAKGVWSGIWSVNFGPDAGSIGSFYGNLAFKASTTPGDYVVTGSMKIIGSLATTGGPVHGTLACDGTFLLGVIEGTATVNFSGTMAAGGSVASGTYSLSNSADFGSWNGGLLAVSVSPVAGEAGTAVTVSTTTGSFGRGENVSVTYATRVAATPSVTLCSGTADMNTGAFSCTGVIPTDSPVGPLGKHTITATGASGLTAKTVYTLTW
jgi:hypothetical protein